MSAQTCIATPESTCATPQCGSDFPPALCQFSASSLATVARIAVAPSDLRVFDRQVGCPRRFPTLLCRPQLKDESPSLGCNDCHGLLAEARRTDLDHDELIVVECAPQPPSARTVARSWRPAQPEPGSPGSQPTLIASIPAHHGRTAMWRASKPGSATNSWTGRSSTSCGDAGAAPTGPAD